jgi:hypothetical protein
LSNRNEQAIRGPLILSSGREIDANANIIGIDDQLDVYGGYDDVIEMRDGHVSNINPPLTSEERDELADHMIDRWRRWKQGRRAR